MLVNIYGTNVIGDDDTDITFLVVPKSTYVVLLLARDNMHRHTFAVRKHTHGIRCLNALLS